jgi:hypothetical protein
VWDVPDWIGDVLIRTEAPSVDGRLVIDHRRRARCIPGDDADFAAFVDKTLGDLENEGDRDLAAALQLRVRERYPAATIVPQDELASLSPALEVVYVYRDGDPVDRSTDGHWSTLD